VHSHVLALKELLKVLLFDFTDAPVIQCRQSYVQVGDKAVSVHCEVRAKPEVTAMFWITDMNGTTVSQGEVTNDYWTTVAVGQQIVVCIA